MSFSMLLIGLLVWVSVPRMVRMPSARADAVFSKCCRVVGAVLLVLGLFIGLLC